MIGNREHVRGNAEHVRGTQNVYLTSLKDDVYFSSMVL